MENYSKSQALFFRKFENLKTNNSNETISRSFTAYS
jgi:hypothetical protein